MKTIIAPRFLSTTATPCAAKPELFHPDEGRNGTQASADRITAAINTCLNCPLMLPCRDWARDHREYGIWGAETDEDRTRAGYRPKIPSVDIKPACGTEASAKWHRRHGSGTPCPSCLAAERTAARRRQQAATPHATPHLTPRETEILHAVTQGATTAQLATQFSIGRKSVTRYLARIRKVLGVDQTSQLAAAAQAAGILPTPEYAEAA